MEAALERLDGLVQHPHAAELVEAYFASTAGCVEFGSIPHPKSEAGFAGATFLDLQPNHPFAISESDLVAVGLMDVSFGPTAVRRLLCDPDYQTRVSEFLVQIPAQAPLWEVDDLEPAGGLWNLIRDLPQVDYVKAGKLLARERPHLIPVLIEWSNVSFRLLRGCIGRSSESSCGGVARSSLSVLLAQVGRTSISHSSELWMQRSG